MRIVSAVASSITLLLLTSSIARGDEPAKPDSFQTRVLPVIERYCVDCHSKEDPEAGIILDAFTDQRSAVDDTRTWLKVRDALEGGVMPPMGEARPSPKELEGLIGWIESDYIAAQCGKQAGPAPVVIRRLNRQQYDNTIRDLLGVNLRLADAFPVDDIGFGFDNVGSALNISPAHVEKYLDAAEAALERAIVLPDASSFPPIELIGLKTYPLRGDKPVEFAHTLKPGRYLVNFSLVRVGIAETAPTPRLMVGLGRDRRAVEAARVQDETVVYRYWLDVAPGDAQVHVSVDASGRKIASDAKNAEVGANVSGDQRYGGDRGLHVDSMVVHGPVPQATLPESHRTILFQTPGAGDEARFECGRKIVARFAERAFRRPISTDELERLMKTFRLAHDRGESFERCVQVALTAVLGSPKFLFLVELDEGGDRPLTEFELASRLSYFLWSTMPDEELFREARQGTLRANLRRQVSRMLDDARSVQLVENFTGQWLQLRRLDSVNPDRNLFPGFDDRLRAAMKRETEQCFADVLRGNRSILELLDSDSTFLNETLARHYGIKGVVGDEFRKVKLADRRRGGILTQASVLTLTSNPNRTSPVKRGQWVLQQLLGTPPPPPPPDVAKLDEGKEAASVASLRERMEIHRADPRCASCHQQMDSLGFALENFDAVGRWRDADGTFAVDSSGELLGGRKFSGVVELKQILGASESKKFTRTLIERMLTYALGRGLEMYDACTIEDIRGRIVADNYKIRGIIFGIVECRAFQTRGVTR